MFRTAAISLCLVVALASTGTANKEEGRLESSGVVLEEVLGVPDNIPRERLDKAGAGRRFVDALEKSAPRNDSKVASR